MRIARPNHKYQLLAESGEHHVHNPCEGCTPAIKVSVPGESGEQQVHDPCEGCTQCKLPGGPGIVYLENPGVTINYFFPGQPAFKIYRGPRLINLVGITRGGTFNNPSPGLGSVEGRFRYENYFL